MQEHIEMQDQETPQAKSEGKAWTRKIRRAKKVLKDYYKEAKEAYELYWMQSGNEERIKFPLFWANTQIQHAAVLANAPKPEVRRRNVDAQGAQQQLAQAIERAVDFQFDTQDLEFHLHQACDDYLVAAMGTCRIHYNPIIQYGDDGNPLMIVSQGMSLEHVPYTRLIWEPNKNWENVGWIAFEHMLTKVEYKEQFPGKPIPSSNILGDGTNTLDEEKNPEAAKYAPLYRVYEIWNRKKREVIVVAEGIDDPIEQRPDELALAGFFPCPRPMMMNLKKDELIPKPDYIYIRSQLKYVNRLTKRIDAITDAIRDIGFYDENFTELEAMAAAQDGDMIALQGLSERLAQAGGGRLLDNLIAKMPIEHLAAVLNHLRDMREDAKQQIYEITGISDIVRGATNPNETATAQSKKSEWAGARFGLKQKEVTRFCRDIIRIMGEIIAEHFEPEVLSRMTGVELTPDMVQVLRDDVQRTFSIDIETDSTIAGDEAAERDSRLEMLNSLTEFLPVAMEMVQSNPASTQLVQQMLLFLVRSFKHGRQLEDEIQAMSDQADPMQQLQQQLEEVQGQLEQAQQEAQAANEQLGQVNEREEGREDLETQATANLKNAQADKVRMEAAQPQVLPFRGI